MLALAMPLALAGCASGPRGYGGPTLIGPRASNLAFADNADENYLASAFAGRSSWPSVITGYDMNVVETFSQIIYDDQSFYEYPGYGGDQTGVSGGYTHQTQSIRSGVRIR